MPFDGNGNFTPATSPGYPAIAGTPILADQFNKVILDIATGLGNTVTRDGQSPATANISMGSNRLTNLADATQANDAVNFKQLAFRGDFLTGVGGSADAITATANAGITSYSQGLTFRFIATNNNTAGTTINVNGLGAVPIRKENNQTLVAGDIVQNAMYQITYNGTQFQITNSSVNPTALQNGRYISYTTAGTAPAYTVDTLPDYSALTTFQQMTVKFHSSNAGVPCTLSLDGGTAKSIKVFQGSTKVDPSFFVDFIGHLVYDGTDWIITNLSSLTTFVANCRLGLNGSSLELLPVDGNKIFINGLIYTIPSAGITLAPPATSGTLYYIYVYNNAGTLALEASTTVYVRDTSTGVAIKTGDASRTLVGMARTDSNAWVNTTSKRFVRSYYNDLGVIGKSNLTANRNTSSGTYVEINAEIRVEYLIWANEISTHTVNGSSISGAAGEVITSIGIDGITPEDVYMQSSNYTANATSNIAITLEKTALSEGYHYTTVLAKVLAASANWKGNASGPDRTTLQVKLRKV